MATTILCVPKTIRRFARDRRGVSAVEFALLAPLMIALYLGCAEISDGIGASRKVSLAAATLANLGSQVTTISTSDMTNMLNASSAIITPYAVNNLKATLTLHQDRCDRQGDRGVERLAQRHRARHRLGDHDPVGAGGAKFAVAVR